MKKKIVNISLVIGLVGLVAFTLKSNKEEMKEKEKLGLVVSETIPVELTSVTSQKLDKKHEVSGSFEAISEVAVISETQGKVITFNKKKGQTVNKGDVLASIDNELALADMQTAQAQYDKMKADLNRFSNLRKSEAITARQLEEAKLGLQSAEAQLKSAKKRVANATILAPISGVIQDDFIQEGSYVSPGMKLLI